MSLKFFFNRRGFVVYTLTILGWLLAGKNSYFMITNWSSQNFKILFWLFTFLFLSLLFTLIRFISWNKSHNKGHGIEEHFEKILVPLAYILVVIHGTYFLGSKWWIFLMVGSLLLLPILYVNFILIYFHLKDKDKTPPGYFSRSLYKN